MNITFSFIFVKTTSMKQKETITNYDYRVGWKKNWTKLLVTILDVWKLLSGFCLTYPMFCDCDILRKRFVIVLYFKRTPQRDNRVKVSALLWAGHKASEAANLVRVSRTKSTWSRSAWTMMTVSTDVQAVVERLLWIVTACGMLFEAVPGRLYSNMQKDLD